MSKGDLPDGGKHDKKTQTHWHRLITIEVLKGDLSERWNGVPDDSKELALIIYNHINKSISCLSCCLALTFIHGGRLKKVFFKCKALLGETGNGIVMDNKEYELHGDLLNIWGTSSVVTDDRSALIPSLIR
jgi:hypothetical protein